MHWEHGLLATGPPRKSMKWRFLTIHDTARTLPCCRSTKPLMPESFLNPSSALDCVASLGTQPVSLGFLDVSLPKCSSIFIHGVHFLHCCLSRNFLLGFWVSLVAQMINNLPAIQETQVWSLGWEDPPEKGKATHSSVLAWRIPRREELGPTHGAPMHRTRLSV